MRADLLADLCWIVRGGNSGVTPRNGVTVTPELRPKGPELRQLRPLRLENNERGNEQKGRRQGGLLRSFGTLRNRNRGTSRPRERSCSGGLISTRGRGSTAKGRHAFRNPNSGSPLMTADVFSTMGKRGRGSGMDARRAL